MTRSVHERMLTSALSLSCSRLEDLCAQVRSSLPELSPELLDEIAGTVGELMLLLLELRSAHPTEEGIRRAAAEAQELRAAVRSTGTGQERVALAISHLIGEVDQIVREEKQAA